MSALTLVAALSVAVAGAWFSRTYVVFQREMRTQRARLSQGSEVIETTSGAVEYGRAGEGLPVLISHGGAGGYDQGLLTARTFLDEGFQAIAPSRFGHLRTPLARDSSEEAQADAYAQLLDALHVERAAILGVSGGGPSSLQFALRHPRRCVALVMSAAVSQYVPARSTGVYRSDFLYWLVTTYLRRMALAKIGVGRDEQAGLIAAERAYVQEIFALSHPISLRTAGLFHDIKEWSDRDRWARHYPLDRISVPTLVVHAVNDTVIPFVHAEHTAQAIPGARLMRLPDGGHLRLGHIEEIREEISDFLRRSFATPA